jgi:D-serine deaminase-like pyridoxal phosphate-dependent protein
MEPNNPIGNRWYLIDNESDVYSPALLVYPDRIEENIRMMIKIAGDADRLRPHVKTHKMPEIVRLQIRYGIKKFKCSTIAEAEMTARCNAPDIMLAYQPVGPNIERFFHLKESYPGTKFSCIADSEEIIRELSEGATARDILTYIWLDINNGMNRTGIVPGKEAIRLARLINDLPMLRLEGLHVYDGHIHEPDYEHRKKMCNESFTLVSNFIKELKDAGTGPLKIVAGGSPTFPVHALRREVELSPGTLLLWDYGYGTAFRDMDFLISAALFARVVSKPANDLICIDLGHKAVASEMPQPRINIPGFGEYSIITHNEEHMVIRTEEAGRMKTGTAVYAIPYHICPTVDRYNTASVVRNGKVTEQWNIEARQRKITI